MKSIYFLCLAFLSMNSFAQNDSLTIVHTKWETTKIAPGVRLKSYAFSNNLFNSNQYISFLEIKQRKKNHISVGAEKKILRVTSEFGQSANAIGALNGTFFDIQNGGSVDYIRSNGEEINSTRLNGRGERAVHQKAAILINGYKLSMASWDGTSDWEKNLKAEDVIVSGPMLVWNRSRAPLDTSSLIRMRHPRSAVARINNKILLIAVDGRHENAAGMSLTELASFLRWMHADEGMNLDGGGSTTLWVNSKAIQGVVNHPSDNKKWDNEGERKVANVLLLKRGK
jgi:exopolysaccharide biosynthesis protein